ncbi:hypothetical protein TpMuguga_04g00240 [Theileria parva strain Muguga]|uniref:uncharacterized protein n=1 Tax=Theileria parva strain Muguga TaxID=333668 RepID=UPI001C621E68|nr:uncharacterized protein TpMuguga_04g00240 [Theileria parva strain Muguga]EAN31592.2 hypothetical protein TpMuguga_04g00240 [Theileria parva strain Muguga]
MDQISRNFENVHKFPNSSTFTSRKSSIAILKIPDPLITITNYKPSTTKCSCKFHCSCPISTSLKDFTTNNPLKSVNTPLKSVNTPLKSVNNALNYNDLATNSALPINNQPGLNPPHDESVTETGAKIAENPAKTGKIVPKNAGKTPKTPVKKSLKRLKKSKTKTKTMPKTKTKTKSKTVPKTKSKTVPKTVNVKSKKCSRKLKRLKKLNISHSNSLNSANSTQSNTNTKNLNTFNTDNTLDTHNTLSSDVISVTKSIKLKTDKCVGTYDIEDVNLDREALNILEHLGEAENLLKFERERRFSQIRSDYSTVRDRIEEKFHLVIMCCRKRQNDLNSKFLQRLDNVEKSLSSIKLPTLKHIKKHLEFFN